MAVGTALGAAATVAIILAASGAYLLTPGPGGGSIVPAPGPGGAGGSSHVDGNGEPPTPNTGGPLWALGGAGESWQPGHDATDGCDIRRADGQVTMCGVTMVRRDAGFTVTSVSPGSQPPMAWDDLHVAVPQGEFALVLEGEVHSLVSGTVSDSVTSFLGASRPWHGLPLGAFLEGPVTPGASFAVCGLGDPAVPMVAVYDARPYGAAFGQPLPGIPCPGTTWTHTSEAQVRVRPDGPLGHGHGACLYLGQRHAPYTLEITADWQAPLLGPASIQVTFEDATGTTETLSGEAPLHGVVAAVGSPAWLHVKTDDLSLMPGDVDIRIGLTYTVTQWWGTPEVADCG